MIFEYLNLQLKSSKFRGITGKCFIEFLRKFVWPYQENVHYFIPFDRNVEYQTKTDKKSFGQWRNGEIES